MYKKILIFFLIALNKNGEKKSEISDFEVFKIQSTYHD